MDDDLYDGDFHLYYPIWLLVPKGTLPRQPDGTIEMTDDRARWLTAPDANGQHSLLAFTDELLAESFRQAAGMEGEAQPVPVPDARRFAELLDRLRHSTKVRYVVFDLPRPGEPSPRVWEIGYAVTALRSGDVAT